MGKTMRSYWLAVMATVLLGAPTALFGQGSIAVEQAYSDGVQAYFAGNAAQADQDLAAATAQRPLDPRPYYFRALSLLRLGRTDEARSLFAKGAEIEAQRPHRFAVGKALERVQGRDRLLLEEYRRRARAREATVRVQTRRARYEPSAGSDAAVLRERVAVPLGELAQPSSLPDWTNRPAVSEVPLEIVPPQSEPEASGAVELAAEAPDDPFADDPQPAAATSDAPTDPFAIGPSDAPSVDAATTAGQKIPAEKLLGIMGRVLQRAVPVPSLDGLGRAAPFVPGGDTAGGTIDASGPPQAGTQAAPSSAADPFDFGEPQAAENGAEQDAAEFADPFGPPAAEPAPPGDQQNGAEPEPSEDDPFGGF